MPALVTVTDYDIYAGLRHFLTLIVPSTCDVIRAQVNRVPEPSSLDFVLMTALRRERLETTTTTWEDVVLEGSIAGTEMTVTSVVGGTLLAGQPLFGPNIAPGSRILSVLSGSGGPGLYAVGPAQTVPHQAILAGARHVKTSMRADFQLDFHGPNSAENAQAVLLAAFEEESAFVSSYEVALMDEHGAPLLNQAGEQLYALVEDTGVVVLDIGDMRQAPFINGEHQYETRWMGEVAVQVNPVILLPQEFAQALNATVTLVI